MCVVIIDYHMLPITIDYYRLTSITVIIVTCYSIASLLAMDVTDFYRSIISDFYCHALMHEIFSILSAQLLLRPTRSPNWNITVANRV